jgi:hypothetical protein
LTSTKKGNWDSTRRRRINIRNFPLSELEFTNPTITNVVKPGAIKELYFPDLWAVKE